MRRLLALWAVSLAFVVGCTHPSLHPTTTGAATDRTVRPAATAAAPSSQASPTVTLPSLELTADLSEPTATWRLIAFIPFGESTMTLRYQPAHEVATLEPTAFAIAPDHSIWILDVANARLAHFAGDGRFLSARPGYHSVSREVVFQGTTMYVARDYQIGLVDELASDGAARSFHLHEGSSRPYITQLVPSPDGLIAEVATLPTEDSGPQGFYSVDTSNAGALREVPGIPIGPGRWLSVDAPTSQDILLDYRDRDRTSERTLHVRIVDSKRAEGFPLEGGVGPGEFVVSGEDVFMYVDVVGILPGDRPAGAHYLLRVGDSPLLWERLPNPNRIADDTQIRHITLGPDGHVYLMMTDHDGVRIYRRP